MNLNKVMLIGNLTKNPEIKATPSGKEVCSFTVATNEHYKDSSGQKQENVEFHNVVAFGQTARNIAQFMKKGSQIFIEGKNHTRSWEGPDGKKLYRTEVVVSTAQFGNKPYGENGAGGSKGRASEEPAAESDPIDPFIKDDGINPADIPF